MRTISRSSRPRRTATTLVTMAWLCAIAPFSALAAQSGENQVSDPVLQPLDIFALEWARNPQVSPDGKTIAYTRSGFDIMKDRRSARIWLIDANRKRHRPMTDRAGGSPVFSPQGDRVVFTSATSQGSEIFMHWLADNRTARLTQLPENPRSISWSPDGRQLAFTMFKPQPAKPIAKAQAAPKGAKWAPPFQVYEEVQYRADGQGYLRPGFNHVYVIDADGGAPRQVTSGDYHHNGGISWAADGKSLFVTANRQDDWDLEVTNTDIYRLDLATNELTALTDRYGPDVSPQVSPNGRYLAYRGFDDSRRGYENYRIYLKDLRSGETRSLTDELDRSTGNLVWRDDSRALYFAYDDYGMGRIGLVTTSGKITDVATDLGGNAISRPYTGGSFDAAAGTVAYTRSVDVQPADLAVAERGNGVSLTNLNANLLDHRSPAAIEEIRFDSSLDGQEIQAWVAKPPGFVEGQKYPLILEIHGGPFAAYGPQFSAEVQLYAAAGYVVVYVNPRGSTSYGEDFANLIHHAYPGGDFDDLMSAVDFTVDAGWADPERLFVTGGSGGGILTAWIITHTDRFKAAVAAKPVINWYSFVLTADAYPMFARNWFDKKPWEDPAAYLERSPLNYVDRANTPTMLLTGENDHRTPISEAEQFYQALKLRGVDSALVRVPGASHGIANRPSQLIGKVAHVLAWFERYDPARSDGADNAAP